MNAKNRPFTQLAAELCYGPQGVKNLNEDLCPCCSHEIGDFRDQLSRKEFGISGLCQKCQDKVFVE